MQRSLTIRLSEDERFVLELMADANGRSLQREAHAGLVIWMLAFIREERQELAEEGIGGDDPDADLDEGLAHYEKILSATADKHIEEAMA